MDAYEALWSERETTFKALSERFAPYPGSVPSDSISPTEAHECAVFVRRRFDEPEVEGSGVRVHGAGESPEKLRNAAYPVALLYYLGWWDLAYSCSIAVVGARKPSRAPDASYARSWPTPRTAEGRAERQRQRQLDRNGVQARPGEDFDGVDDGRPRRPASPASMASCRVPASTRVSAEPDGAAQEGPLAPAPPNGLATHSQPVTRCPTVTA